MTLLNIRGHFHCSSVWGGITMTAGWDNLTIEESDQAFNMLENRVHPTEIFPDRLVTWGEIVPESHQSGIQ